MAPTSTEATSSRCAKLHTLPLFIECRGYQVQYVQWHSFTFALPPLLQRTCSDKLESIHGALAESRIVDLGGGNGFNFRANPYCHYATDNHVSCLFAGQVAEWPGLDLMADNHNGKNVLPWGSNPN